MISLPSDVARVLDAASRRVRRILVLRGVVATGTVFVATALAAMAVDAWWVFFDDLVRFALSALIWLPTAATAFFTVVRPFLRPISRREAAEALDQRHSEHEEILTTIVELSERNRGEIVSEQLYRAIALEGSVFANRLDLGAEFTARTVVRRLKWLGAALAVMCLSFAVFPRVAGLLFVRSALPWVDIGNVYANWLEVTPGNVAVLAGTNVEISAKRLRDFGGEMTIRISRHDGSGWGREFSEPLAEGGYRELADLSQPLWRYRVACGPAVSRYYVVRVCERPKYKSFVAELDYPAYTRKARIAYTNDAVGAIQAIEGTRVSFGLELDGRGTTGELRLEGGDLALLSDGGRLSATMVSNRVAVWSLQLVSPEGFRAPRRSGPFVSVPDQRPAIVVESPSKPLQLAPHAMLPIVYTASDDVGVAELEIRSSIDDGPWEEVRTERFRDLPALRRATAEVDLSWFDLYESRSIRFDLIVRDGYPGELGGPHAATSTPVTVNFRADALSFEQQSLEQQTKDVFEALREAERRFEEAQRLAEESRQNVAREKDKTSERTEQRVNELAHAVHEAEKRLEEMAERLEKTGTFEPIAEELRAFAEEELEPVREKLEEAQFAESEKRVEALKDVQPMLKEARERVAEAEKDLKERAEKLGTYEKTKDLAQRQEALAKAAEKILAERPVDSKKLDAWKRLEEAAAKAAEELDRRNPSVEVEDARRKMERAAEKMAAFREELRVENDKKLSAAEKNLERAKAAVAAEKVGEQALNQARQQAKRAEELVAKALESAERAAKATDFNQRDQRVREAQNYARSAAEAQKAVLDQLSRTEEPEEVSELEREAARAVREADGEAADRVGELKRALEAQREVGRRLAKPDGKKSGEDAAGAKGGAKNGEKSAAESAAERSPEERRQALGKALKDLREAESQAEKALSALRRHEGEEAVKALEAERAAEKSARAAHPANALDRVERSEDAAKSAAESAKRNPNNEGQWNNAVDRQKESLKNLRKAVEALAAEAAADVGDEPEEAEREKPEAQDGDDNAPSGARSAALAEEAAKDIRSAAKGQAKKLGVSEKRKGPSSGGVSSVMKEVSKDAEAKPIPDSERNPLSRKGWFRIRGSVREGLGERDLKDIPPEYRDLVRRYFLKLAE